MNHNDQSDNRAWSLDFSDDFGALENAQSLMPQPQGRLCAGLVLITHGFNAGFVGEPEWMSAMQNAMIKRIGANAKIGRIHVSQAQNRNDKGLALSIEWENRYDDAAYSGGSDCEIFIRVDWTAIANYLLTGISTDVIASSLAAFLCSPASGIYKLKELPIHLIGHSRGASLVCELANNLGRTGMTADHVTTLDPHPLTQNDLQPPGKEPIIDAPVVKHANIRFMDNYWQSIAYPKGNPVKGAYNRCFSKLPGAYHFTIHAGFGDHMNIVMAYLATIDLNSPPDTTEAVLKESQREIWFLPEEEKGAQTGFYFSRTISPESRPELYDSESDSKAADDFSDTSSNPEKASSV